MAQTEIALVHWLLIEKSFKDGTCVPFLGPGVNAPYGDYPGFKSNHEIAFELLNDFIKLPQEEIDKLTKFTFHEALQPFKDLTRFGINDLAQVALRYQNMGGQGLLIQRLRELRNDENQEPSKLLALIAKSPFKLIATANFDRLMEKALNNRCMVVSLPDVEQGVIPQSVLQESLSNYYQRAEGPILYKFCGSYVNGSGLQAATQPGEDDKELELTGEQREYLLTNIHRSFSSSEIKTLILNLELDFKYDDLPGGGLQDKIRELILALERRQRVPDLIEKLIDERPRWKWDVFKEQPNRRSDNQSLPATHSEQVIVSEEDFFSILSHAGNEEARSLFQQLQGYLTRSKLLLFLGFRLESWEFRIMYKTLVENQGAIAANQIRIAIQKEPSEFWVNFWTKKGVECYDMDPNEFARLYEER